MNYLSNITAAPLQQQNIVLPDGTTFSMTIYYVPMQYGWYITNLTYGTFILNSVRITNNANMLYQWQNLIPFGLACFSNSQREPSLQQDFLSKSSNLYVLTQAECEAYAAYIRGGSLPS